MSFYPHYFICFATAISLVGAALNILQIAPNFLDSNFELSVRFAKILGESGHKVNFLIPLSKPSTEESSKSKLNNAKNVHIQVCKLSKATLASLESPELFMDPPPENIQKGGWTERHFCQSPAIAYVEGFEVIADIFRQTKECWEELEEKKFKFDVGLMDIWDFGALALFRQLGIQNVVLIHNLPIMSHMYDLMNKWETEDGQTLDYKQQILDNGVPELFSATINDEKIGKSKAFNAEHTKSTNIFTAVYQQADKKFKTIFQDEKFPSLNDLFGDAKYLFVNTIPELDYTIGKLPKRVKFIGGIDLMAPNANNNDQKDHAWKKVLEKKKPVVVFTMSPLIEPSKMPDEKFESVIDGLALCKEKEVIWKYDTKHGNHQSRKKFVMEKAQNVHLLDDFDKCAVIGDQLTELVISECDIRTTMDALSKGKPMLCLPMFAEHFYVAEKLRRMGAAVVLDPRKNNEFSPALIAEGIRECIALKPSENNLGKDSHYETLKKSISDAFAQFEQSSG